MTKLKLLHWVVLVTLLGCVVSAQAADATQPLGLGTPVMDAFAEIAKSFEAALKPAGLRLFGLLMLIEASVWSFKTLMQDETSVGSWAFGLTRRCCITLWPPPPNPDVSRLLVDCPDEPDQDPLPHNQLV